MKMRFLRLLGALLTTACILVGVMVPSFAASNDGAYHSIDVSVTLLEDGSAQIIEEWEVNLDSSWSEIYIPKTNLGEMEISNLQVKEVTDGSDVIHYTTLEDEWDVGSGLSTDDKRILKYQKCGIAETDDGVELCWGVSGSGHHTYQVSYLMTNVVQSYEDGYDGFHIRFINASMDPDPEHISVTIDTEGVEELTSDNTKFWAFGFMGTTRLEDGKVIVESDEGGTINYGNVMVRFEKGLFTPSVDAESSFYDLVETAFEGSNYDFDAYVDGNSGDGGATSEDASFFDEYYDGDSLIDGIGNFFLYAVGFLGIIGLAFMKFGKTGDTTKRVTPNITRQEKKEVLYSRDIPFDGSLEESYMALDSLNELDGQGVIIEAYLLKWMKLGLVRMEERPEKRLGGLLGEKMTPSIVFTPNEENNVYGAERNLWTILQKAAGDDGILQEKELKKYAQKNYEDIAEFFQDVLNEGKADANKAGHLEIVEEKSMFGKKRKTTLSAEGKKKFLELLGFKKYLKEFTIINEREARDVGLWGDYLTYAALFGIADEVAEQFKELVPDFFENPQNYGYYGAGWDTYDMLFMMHMVNSFSRTAYDSYMAGRSATEISTASSGGGGFSSFGGGGGFSGGGFGGGGR